MKLKLVMLVLALQTAWLLGMVATQEYSLAHGKLTARAFVPASGRAKLQQVFLDGKPYERAVKQ